MVEQGKHPSTKSCRAGLFLNLMTLPYGTFWRVGCFLATIRSSLRDFLAGDGVACYHKPSLWDFLAGGVLPATIRLPLRDFLMGDGVADQCCIEFSSVGAILW